MVKQLTQNPTSFDLSPCRACPQGHQGLLDRLLASGDLDDDGSLFGGDAHGVPGSRCSRPKERSSRAWRSVWREVKPNSSDASLANPPLRSEPECSWEVTQPPGNRS